jgi:hypothetical protein
MPPITGIGAGSLQSRMPSGGIVGRFHLMAESVSLQYDRGRFSFQVEASLLQPETIAL